MVGFGGLIRTGRIELLQIMYGMNNYEGEVYYKGKLIKNMSPRAAVDRGFSMVPENRKDRGLMLSHPVQSSTQMTVLDRISKVGLLSGKKGE